MPETLPRRPLSRDRLRDEPRAVQAVLVVPGVGNHESDLNRALRRWTHPKFAGPTGRGRRRFAAMDADVLARFLGADGRLAVVPTKRNKRLVVLDHIAQRFEPGRRYAETEVNEVLTGFHDDYAALRRYLVDERFLQREAGVYWRTGGTVPG
jgi:hypothetical protein